MIINQADLLSLPIEDIIHLIDTNGGITVTQEPAWSIGYVVGGKFEGELVFEGEYTSRMKLRAVAELLRRLGKGDDVGIWVEAHDVWVVDSVDRAPTKGAAVLLAASRGERAYWDIANAEAIPTYG